MSSPLTANRDERAICDWLGEQYGAMLELLEEVVNIDSGSFDKEGVDAVGERFRRFFAEHGIPTSSEPSETHGDAIFASIAGTSNESKPVLLMGHRDTVFPKGEVGRRPFKVVGGRAYGPGAADMKAGLVMNAFVMAAFRRLDAPPVPLVALLTGDEEIASPFSRTVIEDAARRARAVFNAEPGRPSGNVVRGRKGGVFSRFETQGKAAHSGANFADGISAIGELAHKIVALHALTDLGRGITVNVGLARGGQSINTTAPNAEGQIDLRYVTPEQREEAVSAIERIMRESTVPGTTASLHILGEFLPLVPTADSSRLMDAYIAAASDSGLEVEGEFSGGCADSGAAASTGTPTICGVGPVGGNPHTPDEYVELDTLVPRSQALARAIIRLGRGG